MPRHASYLPNGVIPAILLPFNDDLSIDERAFRSHIRDVGATQGISALTINAHSTEVASCTFDEQRRVLDIAQDEIGDRLPLVHGIWGDEASKRRALRRWRRLAAPPRCWCFRLRRSRWGRTPAWRSRTSGASRMRATCRSSHS